jgi:2-oxo-4-hydroxy-4-carboxy-5-ureidoimidazoline decarboxylase
MSDPAPPTSEQGQTRLNEFNRVSEKAAAELLRPCLDVDRWVATIVEQRPYSNVEALQKVAREAADPLTGSELEAALAHHPRIGQRAAGGSAEAALSRSEQAGLERGADLEQRLTAGNEAYERRFGRVFLIRAAGRSTEEILAQLEARLDNDLESEDRVVAGQLREIALLRLSGRVAE